MLVVSCAVYSANNTSSSTDDSDCEAHTVNKVFLTDTGNLRIFSFSDSCHWDLVCGNLPSEDDSTILFCAEAAFTGQCLDEFSHSNILGKHVSDGVSYSGYADNKRYAVFCWNEDTAYLSDTLPSSNVHTAFTQHWVIRDDTIYSPGIQRKDRVNTYRVLALVNGEFCIIESNRDVTYELFCNALLSYGVEDAIYMDMGAGWNYSFYRDENDSVIVLHPKAFSTQYCTNWLVVRK